VDTRRALSASDIEEPARGRFLEEALLALAKLTPVNDRLVVDLSGLSVLDSAALRFLVEVQGAAASERITVRLEGLTDEHRMVLVLAKLDDRFELEEPA
jgi:anti-anti-sigma regulatory factor